MNASIARLPVLAILLFGLPLFAGLIVLQVFLSKKESRWPGLILPGITVLCALSGVLGLSLYAIRGANMLIVMLAMSFVVLNIPTAIFLIIYFLVRSKPGKKPDEMKKMNIQDLE